MDTSCWMSDEDWWPCSRNLASESTTFSLSVDQGARAPCRDASATCFEAFAPTESAERSPALQNGAPGHDNLHLEAAREYSRRFDVLRTTDSSLPRAPITSPFAA